MFFWPIMPRRKENKILYKQSLRSQFHINGVMKAIPTSCAPLHEECPRHHGHKGDPGQSDNRGLYAVGERAQTILVRMRGLGIGNASYPRRLGIKRVRP